MWQAAAPQVVNHAVPPALICFVERAVSVDCTASAGTSWTVLPSGCFGLRVVIGPATDCTAGEEPRLLISGIVPRAFQGRCERSGVVLAVALTPHAMALLPAPSTPLNAEADGPALALIGARQLALLNERLAQARSVLHQMRAYLGWLEALFESLPPASDRRATIADVAQKMRQGQMRDIEAAADQVGVSRRQFERDFRQHLGVSPKQYLQVCTFQRFAQLHWRGLSLAAIAAELELTDQAHLTRAVKAMTGQTPAQLLARAAISPMARATRVHWGGRLTQL